MKYVFFGLSGFLIGFLLIGGTVPRMMALAGTPAKAPPRAVAPVNPGTAVASGDSTTAPTPAAARSTAPADPPRPARERPGAFWLYWNFFTSFGGEGSAISTHPELLPLYRQVLAAEARNRLAPIKVVLNLSDPQVEQLIEAAVDQRIAYRTATEAMDANPGAPRDYGKLDESLSRETEARLSGFLSPEQIEQFASLRFEGNALSSILERYASHGIVLSPDVLRANLKAGEPVWIWDKTFAVSEVTVNSKSAGLTDDQRARMREWEAMLTPLGESSRLADRLRSTSVRDPEVFDIWPW